MKNEKLIRIFKSLFPSLNTCDDDFIESIEFNQIDGWDSLSKLNLIVLIEEEFKVAIDDEFAYEMQTYAELIAYLDK